MTVNNDTTNKEEDWELTGSGGVLGEDFRVNNKDVYNNELGINKDLVDRVEIEYSEARRACPINLGKMDSDDEGLGYGIGAEGTTLGGSEGRRVGASGGTEPIGEVISTIWMDAENDLGWQPHVKDKIKEKTGKWERFLLKGNLGRRWI